MNLPLPEQFLSRMREQLGEEGYRLYVDSMRRPPQRSLRVNTLKKWSESFRRRVHGLVPNGISNDGYLLPESIIPSVDPFHIAGLYYMQEASAQYPVAQLTEIEGDCPIVLDLCAAPGGKTGQLAQLMRGKGVLIANEPVESRCSVLCSNVERLGITNSIITNMFPEKICSILEESCDLVLVDAPCSGEGMFRKEPAAVKNWSVAAVRSCAVRQASILACAARAVKPGGLLLYSTCTFSEEENEHVIEKLLSSGQGFSVLRMGRIYPHTSCGEGQFFSMMKRTGRPLRVSVSSLVQASSKREPSLELFFAENFPEADFPSYSLLRDGRAVLLPPLYPSDPGKWRIRSAGTIAGEFKKNVFIPSHGLYLRSDTGPLSKTLEPDESDLFRFYRGETLRIDPTLKGWIAVTADGIVTGFGKADHGTLKNHFPKGLRLHTDSIQRSSVLY